MVGVSIMGITAPTILQMSITPVIAQKRAKNYGIAESAAAVYVAKNVTATSDSLVADAPDGCTLDRSETPAYEIQCTEGINQFEQVVSRSFIIKITNNNSASSGYQFDRPERIGDIQCPTGDPWGVNHTNEANAEKGEPACKPHVVWTKGNYENSIPENWLYDIDNFNGWGFKRASEQ